MSSHTFVSHLGTHKWQFFSELFQRIYSAIQETASLDQTSKIRSRQSKRDNTIEVHRS